MNLEQKHLTGGGRNYNIDLLKIISMIMVVILHINLFGGLINSASHSDKFDYKFFVNFYEEVCVIAVNVFVVISSWFLSSSTSFKTKKIIQLIVSMFFWYIGATIVAFLLGIHPDTKGIASTLPLVGTSYGFISGYLVLFLLSPYINKLTERLSKKSYRLLAIGLFVVFSLFAPLIHNGYLLVNSGYSFAWFICIYIITGYIRKHLKWQNWFWYHYLVSFVLMTLIGTLSRCFQLPLYLTNGHYNDPVIFISALSCFLFFASIRVESGFAIKIISFFVPLSVAVFFIHANPFIEQWFSTIGFNSFINENTIHYMVIVPALALLVFIFCTVCDYVRDKLFSILRINKLVDKLSSSLDKHLVF